MQTQAEFERQAALRVHIRWMIRRDMPEVLEIEGDSFDDPWTEEDFLRCLRQRNCIGMVAERHDRVLGFMVYELHKTRLHLLNLAVHPDHRGERVGHAMLDKLKSKLTAQRRTRIVCEVRDSNLHAHLWLKAGGFRAVSVLRGFYAATGNDEDAYVFQFRKPPTPGVE